MDEFDRVMFDEGAGRSSAAHPAHGIVEFSEAGYLRCYPDVAELIEHGGIAAALDHYLAVGRSEGRLAQPNYLLQLADGARERPGHGEVSVSLEAALLSTGGTLFLAGWSDDRANALRSISAIRGSEGWNSRKIGRCRREDAEQALGAPASYPFGFWLLEDVGALFGDPAASRPDAAMMFRSQFADGRFTQVEMRPRLVDDADLRETALGYFAGLAYLGNRDLEASQALDQGIGEAIIGLNRRVTSAITSRAHVERFGPSRPRFDASYIVCLFGRHEYFYLQNALFAKGAAAGSVEFIYVSNSPELTERLQKEARIAERIYGLSVTLVILTGNAGFSAANNAAARVARSDRLVFLNPDVFPRDDDWAVRHAALLASRPRDETRLFGAPLYYDDGSLMHGGMYFLADRGLSVRADGIEARPLLRVEHYGKGAPAWSAKYAARRPVPAVTGAFISVARDWFERLGGFSEDYVFGHYEDADLCLRSLQAGVPAWLQDIAFWHLEGKGSVRRPVHEGGSLVNRWHFTRTWGALIEAELLGRTPSHPLLSPPPAAAAGSPAAVMDAGPEPRLRAETPAAAPARTPGPVDRPAGAPASGRASASVAAPAPRPTRRARAAS